MHPIIFPLPVFQSSRLISLSLAANHIERIEQRALDPLHQLSVLSLQNNKLKALALASGTPEQQPKSVLRQLRKLNELFLSGNQLSHVDEADFAGLQVTQFSN